MKKNKILTGGLIALAASVSMQPAMAAGEFLYKSEGRVIGIDCSIDNPDTPFANILVLPADTDRAEITEDSFVQGETVYKMVHTAGGGVEENIKLDADHKKGEYILYLECGDFSDRSIFTVSDASLADAVKSVNGGAALKNVSFGGDEVFFGEHKSDINLLIKNAKPKGGYSNNDFADEYMRASGIVHLMSGDTALEDFADLYESYFAYDLRALSDMDEDMTKAFMQAVTGYDIGECSADQVIDGAVFVSEVKSASEQNKLIEIMQKYIADGKLSEGKYDKLNTLYASKARSQFKDAVATLDSAEKIYDKYIEICDELYTVQNDSASSGGGGGGGGGSSSGRGNGGGVSLPLTEGPASDIPASGADKFSDISGHWSAFYVKACSDAGIINGYTDNTFRPDAKITRAETAALIYKLFDLASGKAEFADVSGDDWFFECVGAAYSAGIIKGYDDETFRPGDNISRQDIAVMLCRALQSRGITLNGAASFADGDSIADYASRSVASLASEGIITGDNGMFRPNDDLTRGEAAALIYRIMTQYPGGVN